MKAELLGCLKSPLQSQLLTKLEPQSTLKTVTQHGDDNDTHTPLNTTLLLHKIFFLPYEPSCHKKMASAKSTEEPISLFLSL